MTTWWRSRQTWVLKSSSSCVAWLILFPTGSILLHLKPEELDRLPASRISIYTDGSAEGNPGPAGAGFFFADPTSIAAGFAPIGISSNNRGELFAVLIAIQYANINYPLRRFFTICTDSVYTKKVFEGTSNPKSNTILIQHTNHLINSSHHNFTFLHCPSHCGIFGNEMADLAANLGTKASKAGEVPTIQDLLASPTTPGYHATNFPRQCRSLVRKAHQTVTLSSPSH